MKRKSIRVLNLALIIALVICATRVNASCKVDPVEGDPFAEQVRIRCTCYTDAGTTATGCQTRHGIIAGNPEWYGCVAMLWSIDPVTGKYKDFLGYYEVLDTGAGFDMDNDGIGDSINAGQTIDVWCASQDEVETWQRENGDYVLMQLVRGVG